MQIGSERMCIFFSIHHFISTFETKRALREISVVVFFPAVLNKTLKKKKNKNENDNNNNHNNRGADTHISHKANILSLAVCVYTLHAHRRCGGRRDQFIRPTPHGAH